LIKTDNFYERYDIYDVGFHSKGVTYMSHANYSLDIISHHSQFRNKSLRKYYVEGIETVGAWGDEPFEIRFKNHTGQKVQVKISLDGTDVLSGEKATTDVSHDMWVVNGYGTLNLKAWPETNNGGASFIFTSANNSVAVHTHGDISCRGIIAAAVYVEGHVEPVRISTPRVEEHHHYYRYPYWSIYSPYWIGGIVDCHNTDYTLGGNIILNGGDVSNGSSITFSTNSNSSGINNVSDTTLSINSVQTNSSNSLESLASVGAGQHVDQKISYVTGLIKPVFTETVRIRYLWWDDLVAKLKEFNVPAPHASGFPGDKKQKMIDLKSTPRVGGFQRSESRSIEQPSYQRI
jgi:hypothetical protein